MTLLGNLVRLVVAVLAMGFAVAGWAQPKPPVDFDLPAQPLETSLRQVADAQKLQIVYVRSDLAGIQAKPLKATVTAKEAIERLLEGTGLVASFNGEGVVVKRQGAAPPDKKVERAAPVAMPQIMVQGSRSLNMDIERSRDDAQPYVIFDRSTIENSGASDVNDFLRKRLPMNTVAATQNLQMNSQQGNRSQINLRGLGAGQTLILVDGHRLASSSGFGGTQAPLQPDINGIPLAAIERIEVLPTTASGIYGGSATAGVINVILRRDYSGAEVNLSYENTLDADAANRRIEIAKGFSFNEGRTNLLVAASYAHDDLLLTGERKFARDGRAAILANNPAFFLAASTPLIGRTPNIRSADGSPLFGPGTANITFVPVGYAGGGGLAPFVPNAGQYNLDLPNSAQLLNGSGARTALVSGNTRESFSATARHRFGGRLEAFLDLSASNNVGYIPYNQVNGNFTIDASAPNNPFGRAIVVTIPTGDGDAIGVASTYGRRVVAGLIYDLTMGWKAEADYTWHRDRYWNTISPALSSLAAQRIRNGTLDVLRDLDRYPIDLRPFLLPGTRTISPYYTTLKDATLRFSGPIGSLPAGKPIVSLLLEHQQETLGDSKFYSGTSQSASFTPSRSQKTSTGYLELRLPIASGLRGLKELELQLAGRIDAYKIDAATASVREGSGASVIRVTNKSQSINPTIALRYQPIEPVTFRASYGTGFQPPAITQLVPNATPVDVIPGAFIDPRRGNERTGILQQLGGGNPALVPEDSKSWSVGTIVNPRVIPDLRLSVDYVRIHKTNNISVLQQQAIIDNETLFPGRIIRAPAAPGDPFGVGRISFIDFTAVNFAQLKLEAYDVALDYRLQTTNAGLFAIYGVATWHTRHETQLIPTAPVVDNVGITSSNPLRLRANAGISWTYGGWTFNWSTRYFDGYLVADPNSATSSTLFQNQGSRRVPSQIYHDITAIYRFRDVGSALVDGTEIAIAVKNVFDKAPPFDAGNQFSGLYSQFGDPKLATYYVSIKRTF